MDKRQIEQAAAAVVSAIDAKDDADDTIANAARSVLAGVPVAGRNKAKSAFYDAIRAQYGVECSVTELKAFAKVGDLQADRILRAYDAARKAMSRLFPKAKAKAKAKATERPSEGIAVPLTRDGLKAWLNAAIAAIQDTEDLAFDANKVLAWARSGLDILG
jgi:flavodoxin